MKKKCLNKTITWYSLLKEAGEEETTHKEEEIITSIQEKEASSLKDKKHVLITTNMDQMLKTILQVKVMKGTIMMRVKFVVGITILLLRIFTGETTLTKEKDELPQGLPAINLQHTTNVTLYVDSGVSSQMTHNSGILTVLNTKMNQVK